MSEVNHVTPFIFYNLISCDACIDIVAYYNLIQSFCNEFIEYNDTI